MNFQAARPTMISAMLAIPVHNFKGGFRGGHEGTAAPSFSVKFCNIFNEVLVLISLNFVRLLRVVITPSVTP